MKKRYETTTSAIDHMVSAATAHPDPGLALARLNKFVIELRRPGKGRPRKEHKRILEVAGYLWSGRTIEEAAAKFNIKPATAERYEKEALKLLNEKSE